MRKVEATFPFDYAMKEPSLWINRAQALLPLSGVSSSSLTFVMFLGTQVIVAPLQARRQLFQTGTAIAWA